MYADEFRMFPDLSYVGDHEKISDTALRLNTDMDFCIILSYSTVDRNETVADHPIAHPFGKVASVVLSKVTV